MICFFQCYAQVSPGINFSCGDLCCFCAFVHGEAVHTACFSGAKSETRFIIKKEMKHDTHNTQQCPVVLCHSIKNTKYAGPKKL